MHPSQADALVSDLNSRQIPQKAGEVVDNLNDSARQVRQMVSEINKPDQFGMSAGANIRESLMNANTATANLADATEALKHNFLTRGFFKKRGYYNLADISPEQYRKDRAFTNPANRRVWLSGSELFQNGLNGGGAVREGRGAFEMPLSRRTAILLSRVPLSLKAIGTVTFPRIQLRFSRSRAALVRQYLQARFQLDSRNVRSRSALKNSPPERDLTGTTWDGICIVVLRKS